MEQELHGYFLEDLTPGMSAYLGRTITESDLVMFSGICGDINPIHLNEAYARRTRFKGRIAQGLLSASLISAVLGTKLPGPGCIYINQSFHFVAPVRIGDTVIARVTVKEVDTTKRRVLLATNCTVDDTLVVDGEALLMVDRRQDLAASDKGPAKGVVVEA